MRVSANEKIVGVIYVVARHIPKAFTLEQVEMHGGHIRNRNERVFGIFFYFVQRLEIFF